MTKYSFFNRFFTLSFKGLFFEFFHLQFGGTRQSHTSGFFALVHRFFFPASNLLALFVEMARAHQQMYFVVRRHFWGALGAPVYDRSHFIAPRTFSRNPSYSRGTGLVVNCSSHLAALKMVRFLRSGDFAVASVGPVFFGDYPLLLSVIKEQEPVLAAFFTKIIDYSLQEKGRELSSFRYGTEFFRVMGNMNKKS